MNDDGIKNAFSLERKNYADHSISLINNNSVDNKENFLLETMQQEEETNNGNIEILTEFLQTTLIIESFGTSSSKEISPETTFVSLYEHGVALLKQRQYKQAAIFLEGAIQINIHSNAFIYLCIAWIKINNFQHGIDFLNQMERRARKSALAEAQKKAMEEINQAKEIENQLNISNSTPNRRSKRRRKDIENTQKSAIKKDIASPPPVTVTVALPDLDLKRFSLHSSQKIYNSKNSRRQSMINLEQQLLELPPLLRQSHFYFMKGVFYHRLGNMSQAIAEASRAILLSFGKSAIAYMLKGDSLKFLPTLDKKELRYYRKAIKLNPKLTSHIGKGFRDDWDWGSNFDTLVEEFCGESFTNSYLSQSDLKNYFSYEDLQSNKFLKILNNTIHPPSEIEKTSSFHYSFLDFEDENNPEEDQEKENEDKVDIVVLTRKRKSISPLNTGQLAYIFEQESKRNYRTIWNEPNGYEREKQREISRQHRIQHFSLCGYKVSLAELRNISPQKTSKSTFRESNMDTFDNSTINDKNSIFIYERNQISSSHKRRDNILKPHENIPHTAPPKRRINPRIESNFQNSTLNYSNNLKNKPVPPSEQQSYIHPPSRNYRSNFGIQQPINNKNSTREPTNLHKNFGNTFLTQPSLSNSEVQYNKNSSIEYNNQNIPPKILLSKVNNTLKTKPLSVPHLKKDSNQSTRIISRNNLSQQHKTLSKQFNRNQNYKDSYSLEENQERKIFRKITNFQKNFYFPPIQYRKFHQNEMD